MVILTVIFVPGRIYELVKLIVPLSVVAAAEIICGDRCGGRCHICGARGVISVTTLGDLFLSSGAVL